MKDFAEELRHEKFWDHKAEKTFQEGGVPQADFIMQNREEIVALCDWITEHQLKSYLEIGIWTGRLISLLHRLFRFEVAAACDLGMARSCGYTIKLDPAITFFEGNSLSPIYSNWRRKLGHIDLTFIDSSHRYEDVQRDFEINRRFPHRFIAFHGIAGSSHTGDGVKQFWEKLGGRKHEIVLPHKDIGSKEPTMGIGIWSAES